MAWIFLRRLVLQEKKTWWQLASRCYWNRAQPWRASELVSCLVGLRTYQHPGYSQFRDRRELVEDDKRDDCPKSTLTEVNIAAIADLVKNDSNLWTSPRRSSDSERGFGKEKVVCTFFSTFLDTWAKGRSSHILPRHYCMAEADKNILTKLLREIRSHVLHVTPEQRDRVLNGLVRHPLGQRNWNSKGTASRPCW